MTSPHHTIRDQAYRYVEFDWGYRVHIMRCTWVCFPVFIWGESPALRGISLKAYFGTCLGQFPKCPVYVLGVVGVLDWERHPAVGISVAGGSEGCSIAMTFKAWFVCELIVRPQRYMYYVASARSIAFPVPRCCKHKLNRPRHWTRKLCPSLLNTTSSRIKYYTRSRFISHI